MRAYELLEYSGPSALRLTERPAPSGGADVAVVAVQAIGVNFPDLLITQGAYQLKPELPFTPGCEVAGTIHSAPPGSGWAPGDRVAAFVWQGGYAELVEIPLAHLVALPADMEFHAAAALLVNHQTVYFGLARRGGLQPGETALIMGAGGGIGSAGVQVAKGLGARVIAGVADESQAVTAREAGADEVLVLEQGFSATVLDLTAGSGVNVALDPLGDWLFTEAVRCLAPEGRILIIGFAAGDIPTIKANRLLLKNVSAVGVAWGARLADDPTVLADGATALEGMYRDGVVRPLIGRRFPFERAAEALELLGRGEIHGKAIIEVV